MKRTLNTVRAIILALSLVVASPAAALLPPAATQAQAATVKIKPASKTISVGETAKIKLKNNKKKAKWASSTGHVQIVDSGKKFATIKGISAGTSRITATVSGKTYSCYVTVKTGGSSNPSPASSGNAEFDRALDRAHSYLRVLSFSKEGLRHQLEYEKFSAAACDYAVNNCGADWKQQALQKAQAYLKTSAFSKSGLQHQLEYEKYTAEEAAYGVENCGADWMEQAVKKAKSYLSIFSYSKERLIDQLEYEGFTPEEAAYGADVAY